MVTEIEEIKLQLKKNRKMIKQIRNGIKTLTLMIILFTFLMIVIPHVNAVYTCNNAPIIGYFDTASLASTPFSSYNGVSPSWITAQCSALGYPNYYNDVAFGLTGINNNQIGYRNSVNQYGQVFASDMSSYYNDTRYVIREINCDNTHYINVGYWYRSDTPSSECVNGTARGNSLSASFTAIPQSGNDTITVNFTPVVSGSNLNRVVWNYDGFLGTETKYTDMNTSFSKTYSTPGYFNASLTAYNDTSNVTSTLSIQVYNYTQHIYPPNYTPVNPIAGFNGSVKVQFFAWDATKAFFQIYPVTIIVHNKDENTWLNQTILSNGLFDTQGVYNFNQGAKIEYHGSAIGYTDSQIEQFTIPATNINKDIFMYPTTTLGAGCVTMTAYVRDEKYAPIVNAKVIFQEGINYTGGYSDAQGAFHASGLTEKSYTISTEMEGYASALTTQVINQSNNVVFFTLHPIGSIVTQTVNPNPNGGGNSNPYYSQKNLSAPMVTPAAWIGTGASCGSNDTTLIGSFKSSLACNGFNTAMSQSLAIVAVIIIICMGMGARYGKSMGAGIGAIVGFVLGFAMNLIPFAVLALFIVILCLAGAAFVFSKSGGN